MSFPELSSSSSDSSSSSSEDLSIGGISHISGSPPEVESYFSPNLRTPPPPARNAGASGEHRAPIPQPQFINVIQMDADDANSAPGRLSPISELSEYDMDIHVIERNFEDLSLNTSNMLGHIFSTVRHSTPVEKGRQEEAFHDDMVPEEEVHAGERQYLLATATPPDLDQPRGRGRGRHSRRLFNDNPEDAQDVRLTCHLRFWISIFLCSFFTILFIAILFALKYAKLISF